MKRSFILSAAVCAAMALASCGSSKESAYRKAYEKAKAQEAAAQTTTQQQTVVAQPVQQQVVQQEPVVTTLEPATTVTATTTKTTVSDNVPVRSESLRVVNGSGLKAYSVVVGSFGVLANAEGLQSRLKAAGYNAQVAKNESNNMYRVIISTFDSKDNAVESRNSIRANYPDAWLLNAK